MKKIVMALALAAAAAGARIIVRGDIEPAAINPRHPVGR